MLELDGTDGGGQLIRTALTLSVLDGRPFRMENVRGNRSNPGLKRQHLACVDLLADLADADVSGADVGSETLTFDPGGSDGVLGIRANSDTDGSEPVEVAVDVGTAGSVTLVADALLPLAGRLSTPVRATLGGGTDVKWSPPTDYLRHVKLPLLRAGGLDADVEVHRRGFYPAGGGELVVDVRRSALAPIDLDVRRGESMEWSIYAVSAEALEDASVADRLAETAAASLVDQEMAVDPAVHVGYVESRSPGAVVTLVAESGSSSASSQQFRAGFAAYGERGVLSEDVAAEAVDAAVQWAETDASIDAHLGDQLVVWLALAGGRVRIPRVTDHVRTNVAVVRAFGYDVSIEESFSGPAATLSASPSE
ncbi:RNA 3'-terminal phosphate cyclase [Halobellus rufus]|uniref:RNA 3'-terminal phosphate cyclase n=1 Tax=Halobellus rufus TaxID=1448860 RepID=UPI000679CAB5|nr:RNA 3'-terminal phosphate cyclase [Halobellus rufus]